MLTFSIFFIAGLLLGIIGLRLLKVWTPRDAASRENHTIYRHHP